MKGRLGVLGFIVACLVAVPVRAHWVQYDYAAWAIEELEFGARARENLRGEEPDPAKVIEEALHRYNVLYDDVDLTPHHARIFSDMRSVGYLSGIIVAEMEKGLLYTMCAATTGDHSLLDAAQKHFGRARHFGEKWTTELATAPVFGETPWRSRFKYGESKQTRESFCVAAEYVAGAIEETLKHWRAGDMPQEEAFGRIWSLTELDQLAPYNWRRQAGLEQDKKTILHTVASLDLGEACLGGLYLIFTGKEVEEDFIAERLSAAQELVRPYYEPEEQPGDEVAEDR